MSTYATPEIHAQINELRVRGMMFANIGAAVGVNSSTASCIHKQNSKTRSLTSVAAKSGHPRILNISDAKFAGLSLARGQISNVVQICNQLFPHVSVQTVRCNLQSIGLKAYVRQHVPLIVQQDWQRRLGYAADHSSWSPADWVRVPFSDEKKFNLFGSDGHQYAWRMVGKSLDPRYTQKMVKHGGGSVMAWGCVHRHGVGRLYRIQGTLTGQYYTEILGEALLGTLKDARISKTSHFSARQQSQTYFTGCSQLASHQIHLRAPMASSKPGFEHHRELVELR